MFQGRSGECEELTLGEDGDITCVNEGLAMRFYISILHQIKIQIYPVFSEMCRAPSVTSVAGEKYGAGVKEMFF